MSEDSAQPPRKTSQLLRSARWFATDDLRGFGHRLRFIQMGYGTDDWVDRLMIAIINTWSGINPCHAHFKERVEDVKRGVFRPAAFLSNCRPCPCYPDIKAVIDSDDLDVTAEHVLILRNVGPQGGPGMPEWGMLPIPAKLVGQGVRDMVRISDARKSGTSYGACILGDMDGVIVIPAHLANKIAAEAIEMTAFEGFVTEQLREGRSILGLYPATDPQTPLDFAAWRERNGC